MRFAASDTHVFENLWEALEEGVKRPKSRLCYLGGLRFFVS
jgi:hypothetical protein